MSGLFESLMSTLFIFMQIRAHMLNIFNQITVKSYTHTIIHLYKMYYACKFTNNIMFKGSTVAQW